MLHYSAVLSSADYNLKFLASVLLQHVRYIQSTCATSGEGLYEGLDWLSSNIANKGCCAYCCYGAELRSSECRQPLGHDSTLPMANWGMGAGRGAHGCT
ncbi:ADP-ribosylation factor 2 [Platanthera zijinensis]|uniref:ADP-ribosylation factor 2 n=1 Tax=Platanthera zijinensis TaxID=2320716 RepID=A0AAP0BK81_9ASPA